VDRNSECELFITNMKHFFCVDIHQYQHEWKLGKREIVWTTPEGRSVFTQFRVFPISTSVDITVYQYGKNVFYYIVESEILRNTQ
jgi:hypothetical protein